MEDPQVQAGVTNRSVDMRDLLLPAVLEGGQDQSKRLKERGTSPGADSSCTDEDAAVLARSVKRFLMGGRHFCRRIRRNPKSVIIEWEISKN